MREDLDLVMLSHLRYGFVWQRPQHLAVRAAERNRVFFWEEPVYDSPKPRMEVYRPDMNKDLWVTVPHLPKRLDPQVGSAYLSNESLKAIRDVELQKLFTDTLIEWEINEPVLWYYTPMALDFTGHCDPCVVVYDCMDELSLFKGADPELKGMEDALFKEASLVFTGGMSLYKEKRKRHPRVYPFPSSVEKERFAKAQVFKEDPEDQKDIPHPRLGFYGVLDERLDIALVDGIARSKPDWHIILIGPVVKIDPNSLPKLPNIHYLGSKKYEDLPSYIAGWDTAALLFAKNEHTQFISPTKTPEYLAAHKRVVSTSIADVVHPYETLGLVSIADSVESFVAAAAELGMEQKPDNTEWEQKVDAFLARRSWDKTWQEMDAKISEAEECR